MKIPPDAIIAEEKITRYLLVPKVRNDKSKFLAKAGFTSDNPEALKAGIRLLAETGEAVEDNRNEYGIFYRVNGMLAGVNGVQLPVITIWLQRSIDGEFRFVTLKPWKVR